jgi:hypothetical protein
MQLAPTDNTFGANGLSSLGRMAHSNQNLIQLKAQDDEFL